MSESSLRVALTGFLQLSHAFRRAAAGRLARFTPARGQSITTPSQHVRPALCADRPRFAALLSSCAQGSALLIFSASLCQYKCCALFLPQLAAHLSPLRRCSALFRSHASHACAGGRHLLRLSMCARRFAPNAHASLRICLPAHTARTLYVVTPPDAPRSGRLARFTPARGRSITTPSQHVRPSLCTERPRLAPEHISPARLLGRFSLGPNT